MASRPAVVVTRTAEVSSPSMAFARYSSTSTRATSVATTAADEGECGGDGVRERVRHDAVEDVDAGHAPTAGPARAGPVGLVARPRPHCGSRPHRAHDRPVAEGRERGRAEALEPDLHDPAGAAFGVEQLGECGPGGHGRLLEQDVGARLERGEREREVRADRRGDHDDVDGAVLASGVTSATTGTPPSVSTPSVGSTTAVSTHRPAAAIRSMVARWCSPYPRAPTRTMPGGPPPVRPAGRGPSSGTVTRSPPSRHRWSRPRRRSCAGCRARGVCGPAPVR